MPSLATSLMLVLTACSACAHEIPTRHFHVGPDVQAAQPVAPGAYGVLSGRSDDEAHDSHGAHGARAGIRHSPATVMRSSRIDPVRMCDRRSTSLPTAAMFANMSRRFAAIVISSTGCAIAPFSTQKPDAPRE